MIANADLYASLKFCHHTEASRGRKQYRNQFRTCSKPSGGISIEYGWSIEIHCMDAVLEMHYMGDALLCICIASDEHLSLDITMEIMERSTMNRNKMLQTPLNSCKLCVTISDREGLILFACKPPQLRPKRLADYFVTPF